MVIFTEKTLGTQHKQIYLPLNSSRYRNLHNEYLTRQKNIPFLTGKLMSLVNPDYNLFNWVLFHWLLLNEN